MHCASCVSHLVNTNGHEAFGSMDYDGTNNVFFHHISDCELVEASQLVEELECSYLSGVELVSASQNVENSLKISGQNVRSFLQPISACELNLMDSRFAKKSRRQLIKLCGR